MSLLNVNNLTVSIEDDENLKEILHGVNIEIKKGEIHVLMGPNGAGKSTLGYALMGNPRYVANSGEIIFEISVQRRECFYHSKIRLRCRDFHLAVL